MKILRELFTVACLECSQFSVSAPLRGEGVDTAEDEDEDEDEDVLIPNSKFTHRFSLFTFLYPPPYWLKMV